MTLVHTPTSLAEALRLMEDAGRKGTAIAGCTDLMVEIEAGKRTIDTGIDLTRISELREIRLAGGYLEIGATCTFSQIREHPLVLDHAPILAEAAATIGAWQIQSRATLGGNLATASPAGDSLPVLLVLDALVLVADVRGERSIASRDFFPSYRTTALRPGELIVKVRVPLDPPSDRRVQLFRKIGTRGAQAVSKASIAFAARLDAAARRWAGPVLLRDVRIAAGSVAPIPLRLFESEAACEGREARPELADSVSEIARREVRPIDDVRSTAAYRAFVVGRVIRRILINVGNDATAPEAPA